MPSPNVSPATDSPDGGPSRAGVGQMFNRIAPRYDLLNRTLSFGLDVSWRKKVRAHLPSRGELAILDVATGTADLALSLAEDERTRSVLGVDIAEEMLAQGRTKLPAHPAGGRVRLEAGDALELSRLGRNFDVVTIAFGIRNVLDVDRALREMFAVLKPGGRVLVLEFSTPKAGLFRWAYELYRAQLLPRVGGWISGDASAYRYLDDTIRTFPSGEAFLSLMQGAGFCETRAHPLTLGTVTLYEGSVPADAA